ncbi:hypothetical protein Gotri_015025 [Gossypium trilobum]|uniref:Uncharacterized protein n=1 Tax=Gossypium trilobum TaxID=34281 RepID=A0A7J9DZK2_9ROSI|nr:hypothetical protein [Gossypium trilobum]
MQDHNQSGCSEELLTESSQEPYNRKLMRAYNGTLFQAIVCLQHMQDHNQYGNPVSIEFHLFKRDLILVRYIWICVQYLYMAIIHFTNNNIQFKTFKYTI